MLLRSCLSVTLLSLWIGLVSATWDCPATPGSFWDWRYSEPTCVSLTVTYPASLPSGQANDVNIRFQRADGSTFTLNFHNNNGFWSGTVVFTYNTHPNWPAGLTVYSVVWVQVAGSNCHWSGNLPCGNVGNPPPVPCVGSWSAWSACSKTCGGGSSTRTFTITTPASNGGAACAFDNGATQSQTCNTQPCPVNCVGSWSSWSTCSATCGGGTSTRTFTITTPASNGGTACSFTNGQTQSQTCNTQPCPVNCVGSWSAWSSCSTTCGGGTSTRTFTITTPASNGGTACSFTNGQTQSQTCNTQPCPVNCVGAWAEWSACSKTCGGGTSTRTFVVTTPASNGGTACLATNGQTESLDCNTQPCPVNCVGSWSAWSTCSKTCGGGTSTRTFTITTPASNGGTACSATNGQTGSQDCNTQPCPVGGGPGGGTWDCPAIPTSPYDWRYNEPTCVSLTVTYPSTLPAGQANDVNIRFQRPDGSTFTLNFHNNNGFWTGTVVFTYSTHPNWPAGLTVFTVVWVQVAGSNCHWTGNLQCGNVGTPPPVPCVGSWSAWSACSKTCGGGGSTRTFTITTPASNGGAPCAFDNGSTQSQTCNTQPCPVNCVGMWSSWSTCSATCGGGTSTRTFTITTPASNGGTACSFTNGQTQSQTCNTQPCPVNCVGSWSSWTTCSATCGGGTSTRTFTITTPASNGGTACSFTNGQTQSQACNTQPCPVGGGPGGGFDCPATPGSLNDWRYPAPTCVSLTVTYPANLPAGQSNDVNIRFQRADGSTFTLNFHKNSGFWCGTVTFTYSTHPNWPAGLTDYTIVWVQVAGSNCHWSGSLHCGGT